MKEILESYLSNLSSAVQNLSTEKIVEIAGILINARDTGKSIYVMGNGGSALTASHFVCDIGKSASFGYEKRFKVICLNDNVATVMAYSNDVSYEDVFVEQLKNFLNKDDVVMAFSSSGNSKNLIKAIAYANESGAVTVGVSGGSGGALGDSASYCFTTNCDDLQITEDIHMAFVHVVMRMIQKTQK